MRSSPRVVGVVAFVTSVVAAFSAVEAGASSPGDAGADAGAIRLGVLFATPLEGEPFGGASTLERAEPGGLGPAEARERRQQGLPTGPLGQPRPQAPRPVVREVRVVGALSHDVAARIVASALATERCSLLPGVFVVRLVVKADGRVHSSQELDAGIDGAACVAQAASRWSFPRASTSSRIDVTISVETPAAK